MRKWFIALFSLFLLFLFLPQIASTRLGRPLFTRIFREKTGAEIEIGSMSFSWLGPQIFSPIQYRRGEIEGSVEKVQISAPFWSFQGPFQIEKGELRYPGGTIREIEGKTEGHNFLLTGKVPQGSLAIQGQFYSQTHYDLTIDALRFPLSAMNPKLPAVLGQTLTLSGHLQAIEGEGTMDLNIQTDYLTTKIHGYLSPEAITLREPLAASLRFTPALFAFVWPEADPLLFQGLEAKNPLQLTLAKELTSFPLPFSLDRLAVQGTLDLGQITYRGGDKLSSLLALLPIFSPQAKNPIGNSLKSLKEGKAWFTPFSFQIEKGTVQIGRVDALFADTLHLCSWGRIDLPKGELHLKLGLPADTLESLLGIKKLSENYVLPIDVEGSWQNPELITGPAAAQIAALLATGQIPKKSLFGQMTKFFSKSKGEKIPPAKRPFPWEKREF